MNGLLLCELHAHTRWSDSYLTLPELVDLYGKNGFDMLRVADHTVRLEDPMPNPVDPWTWPAYLPAVRAEAARAFAEYRVVGIPGLDTADRPRARVDYLRSPGRVRVMPFALEQPSALPLAA